MASWIAEKAAQVKKLEDDSEKLRQWRLHEAEVIRARGRDVLEQLEAAVRKDVEDWNLEFPNQQERHIDGVGKWMYGGFVVRKTHYPAATVQVSFKPESLSVNYKAVKSRPIGEGEYSTDEIFHLRLAENGDIYITNHSCEHLSLQQVSRNILEQVIE